MGRTFSNSKLTLKFILNFLDEDSVLYSLKNVAIIKFLYVYGNNLKRKKHKISQRAWASAGEGKRGHLPPPPGKFCHPLEKSLRTPMPEGVLI